MSGYAAIGLALGRAARAQSCSRPKDQEDDRPTSRPGATSRITRSSLRSSLHRFGSGATASYPPRAVLTPGARFARAPGAASAPARRTSGVAKPLARRGEPTRLPGGRPSSLASQRSACAATARRRAAPSSHVSSGRANRPPGRRVRAPALGPDRARRERSEPRRQHRPKVGYDVVRAASERRREERSDDRVIRFVQLARRVGLSSSWSWVRLHALGNERGVGGMGPVSSWHRARRAMSRRRRAALVDGSERLG